MIYIERTIEISNNEAKIYNNETKAYSAKDKIEEPVVLYKGDKNVELQFLIENNPFKYKSGVELTYGQLIIKRPKAASIFSDVAKLSNSKVLFTVTGDMIDELGEVGNYDFQIRLINADKTSRGTLPPVTAGIIIKEPICEEEQEGANYSRVNQSKAATSEVLDAFDENGNYIKTEWKNGDIITDSKLNKVEDALYEINNKADNIDLSDYATKDDLNNKADAEHMHDEYITRTEFNEAINNIFDIISGANVSYDEPTEALAISEVVEQEVIEEEEQLLVDERKTYYDSNNENLMM